MIITLLSLTGFLKIIEEIILFKVMTLLFMVLLQYLDTKQILPSLTHRGLRASTDAHIDFTLGDEALAQ